MRERDRQNWNVLREGEKTDILSRKQGEQLPPEDTFIKSSINFECVFVWRPSRSIVVTGRVEIKITNTQGFFCHRTTHTHTSHFNLVSSISTIGFPPVRNHSLLIGFLASSFVWLAQSRAHYPRALKRSPSSRFLPAVTKLMQEKSSKECSISWRGTRQLQLCKTNSPMRCWRFTLPVICNCDLPFHCLRPAELSWMQSHCWRELWKEEKRWFTEERLRKRPGSTCNSCC